MVKTGDNDFRSPAPPWGAGEEYLGFEGRGGSGGGGDFFFPASERQSPPSAAKSCARRSTECRWEPPGLRPAEIGWGPRGSGCAAVWLSRFDFDSCFGFGFGFGLGGRGGYVGG